MDELGCIDLWETSEQTPEETLPNLWTRAANMLRDDQDREKRTLIDQYLKTLEYEFGIASLNGNGQPLSGLQPAQAAKFLEAKAEELRGRQLIIGTGKFQFNIDPYLINVIKHIAAAKDLITAASSTDPHASAACAGVVVILNLLIRQADQREVLFKGLQDIASIICRYMVMEAVYLSRVRVGSVEDKAAEELKHEFENNLSTCKS
ncbi:hypothetical protein GCG54_00015118 [Colletotrichum gloeosporioides]|uniref:NWD NACHT-NTPase N-terminal domain-containing protein n=1 Tax=Colletotrichum gloeosporioides TaxID=474922 RepID=A0A8H4CDC7_COLGL|nr:uncharacterized protein GCG54_00015118 [Colletotrichum gloeosporioides]KAF3801896.1 hypothetical protein GCG54_00015118 [Colletotrichum gloeosporioides]